MLFAITKRNTIEIQRLNIGNRLGYIKPVNHALCIHLSIAAFRTKWDGGEGTSIEFAMNLFAGLIVFNIF